MLPVSRGRPQELQESKTAVSCVMRPFTPLASAWKLTRGHLCKLFITGSYNITRIIQYKNMYCN